MGRKKRLSGLDRVAGMFNVNADEVDRIIAEGRGKDRIRSRFEKVTAKTTKSAAAREAKRRYLAVRQLEAFSARMTAKLAKRGIITSKDAERVALAGIKRRKGRISAREYAKRLDRLTGYCGHQSAAEIQDYIDASRGRPTARKGRGVLVRIHNKELLVAAEAEAKRVGATVAAVIKLWARIGYMGELHPKWTGRRILAELRKEVR